MVALRGGGFDGDVPLTNGFATDNVASVFAAIAAGGGAAVTIGLPSMTGDVTALVT